MKQVLRRGLCEQKQLRGCLGVGLLGVALLCTDMARAEKFLTIEEAQKLCFPQGNKFDPQVIRFTPAESSAIARKIRGRVINQGQRYWVVSQGTNFLGVLILDHVLGKHEVIDYAVALDAAGAVRCVEVLEYRESHGSEIRGEKWRAQFHGKNARSPLRIGDDIFNVSGATVSCRAVTDGIKRVLATDELLIRPRLKAPPDDTPKPTP